MKNRARAETLKTGLQPRGKTHEDANAKSDMGVKSLELIVFRLHRNRLSLQTRAGQA